MTTYRRTRRDSVPATRAPTFDLGPQPSNGENSPDDSNQWDELQRFVSSPSAPTTPRTKRKIHFIEPSPEHIAPRRSNTAPPGFRVSSTTTLEQEQPFPGGPDAEGSQPDLISFEEHEEPPSKITRDLDEGSTNSYESDQPFYDMEVNVATYNDDSTPTEELPQVSQDENDDAEDANDPIFSVMRAKSHSISGASALYQERPASTRFYRTSSASGLYSKPAYSPIIKAHVAGSPIRFDFATTPGENDDSDEQLEDYSRLSRSQTASSRSSNSAYSATWDDKVTDKMAGPSSDTPSPRANVRSSSGSGSELALEAVKRKLSTISRTKKVNMKHVKRRSVEPLSSPDDIPAPPPNTLATSDTLMQSYGGYSAKHIHPGNSSPAPGQMTADPDEAQCPTQSARLSPHLKPALKHVGPSTPAIAIITHDRSVASHKDSLELVRHRFGEEWPTVDPQLSCTRDSIVLAKQRWEKYPRSHAVIDNETGHVKYGGLSPIMDASPPDQKVYLAARREQLAKQREMEWHREIGGHPENDDDCPVCEVERSRTKRLAALRAS
ncbi:hypothetical protein M436DRAFT_76302 [Aureobasidium namibiae CBS 147.97]|uniref:Uncharacterized protein n=1 Tax=Aureobasidium namibiae CBS 147.97 TaxID=1043004 RepID=A0A074X435_9PEZI|nr:uncharacterized protein M436DRAFT_76302 [Aureobasidium namibiae CBS 147.97]KEQ69381.1 hypothetical protein M436DRAFT_76302 [Aureobasidium namibiae CBS 147.97]